MTGIFKTNLPPPKHIFIWDVEQVLKYPGSKKTNEELFDWFLLLKLSLLLSPTIVGRRHEISYLDVRYMIEKKIYQILFF